MASSKDTFEAHTFGANTFACGTLRGLGAVIAVSTAYLFLTGLAQRNLGGEGMAQRNVAATGTAQRNVGLEGDARAGS